MNHADETIGFACGDAKLGGILSVPRVGADTAVVIVVGGPQYRVGSHRQFVLLARRLADGGYPVLRFDVRGMGDSSGAPRSFESIGDDVAAAIDALQQRLPEVDRVVLWGLCDGASAALLYMHDTQDPRVCGLCLLNPWVRSEASLAVTHIKHYYTRRLLQGEFWAKLASGKVGLGAQADFMRKIRIAFAGDAAPDPAHTAAPYPQRMASAWNAFNGRILLLLSGQDLTAKEFLEHATRDNEWQRALRHPRLARRDFPAADHTFSDAASRQAVEAATVDWIKHVPTR